MLLVILNSASVILTQTNFDLEKQLLTKYNFLQWSRKNSIVYVQFSSFSFTKYKVSVDCEFLAPTYWFELVIWIGISSAARSLNSAVHSITWQEIHRLKSVWAAGGSLT